MRVWRALSTTAVVVAIGACAITVVALASTESRDERDVAATPSPTTSAPTPTELAEPVVPSAAPSRPVAPTSPTAQKHPPVTTPASTPAPPRPKATPTPTRKPVPKPTSGPASHPAAPRGQSLPLGYFTGNATRVITVVASSTGSTTARLQAWTNASGGGWLAYGSAVTAHVGSQGLTTHPSERLSATPIGSFTLTQAFGAMGNPGTGLPYFQTDSRDWWVSDSNSRYYNRHYRCSAGSCPFNTGAGENLLDAGSVYNYAVVIDYNRFPAVEGNGSAFFLHVTNGQATAGCVAIPQNRLVSLMRWLTPGTHPRILIGVA
jgi:L,D-peptidoglycan transpeptidase YkuD (ErfK/YbiS/YcfS/YnhG family)